MQLYNDKVYVIMQRVRREDDRSLWTLVVTVRSLELAIVSHVSNNLQSDDADDKFEPESFNFDCLTAGRGAADFDMLAMAADRQMGIFRVFRVIFHANRIQTTIFQATIKLKFLTPSICPAPTDPERSTPISASLFKSASLYILSLL